MDRDVPLTGADVVRIATALEVAPTTFATSIAATGPEAAGDDGDAFLESDPRDPRRTRLARLVLRRVPEGAATACVFLLGLGSGRRACGLGALAPTACRLHPATDAGPGACWRAFGEDEVAPVRRALAGRLADERAAWWRQVARWNAAARSRPVPMSHEVLLDSVLARAAEPEPT